MLNIRLEAFRVQSGWPLEAGIDSRFFWKSGILFEWVFWLSRCCAWVQSSTKMNSWVSPLCCLTLVQPVNEEGAQRLLPPNMSSYSDGDRCTATVQGVFLLLPGRMVQLSLFPPIMHRDSPEADNPVPGDLMGLWKEGYWLRAQSCAPSSAWLSLRYFPTPLSPLCTAVLSTGARSQLSVSLFQRRWSSSWPRGLNQWRPPAWDHHCSHPSLPLCAPLRIPLGCGSCCLPSRASPKPQIPVQGRDKGCLPQFGTLFWTHFVLVWVHGEPLEVSAGWKYCSLLLADQHCGIIDCGRQSSCLGSRHSLFGLLYFLLVQGGTWQGP